MKFLVLPDGRRIDLEGCAYAIKDNQTIVINTNGCCESSRGVGDTTDEFRLPAGTTVSNEGANAYEYTAITPGDAYAMMAAIDNFVSGGANISAVPVASGGTVPCSGCSVFWRQNYTYIFPDGSCNPTTNTGNQSQFCSDLQILTVGNTETYYENAWIAGDGNGVMEWIQTNCGKTFSAITRPHATCSGYNMIDVTRLT